MKFNHKEHTNEKTFFLKFIYPFLQGLQPSIQLPEKMHEQCPHFMYNDMKIEVLINANGLSLFCLKHSTNCEVLFSELEEKQTKESIKTFFDNLGREQQKYLDRKAKIAELMQSLNEQGHNFEYLKEFREATSHHTISCNGIIFVNVHFSLTRIKDVSFKTMYVEKNLRDMTMTMIRSLKAVEELIALVESFSKVRNEIEN